MLQDYFIEVEKFCSIKGIPFYERNVVPPARASEANYSFAIGWKWMIRGGRNLIVFHDSLLPKYRGFAPLVNMLINGEPAIGVTALLANEEYDRGNILAQESRNISYPIRIERAIDHLLPLYAKLVKAIAGQILKGCELASYEQNEREATYSMWRDENDYLIDWSLDSAAVKRFIDSVGYPYKGASALLNGAHARILDAEVVGDVVVEDRTRHLGKIIFFANQCPVVVCGTGLLKLCLITADADGSVISQISFRSRFEGC
ncbi:formyltransferase family protein [Marinobacter sp. UBA2688]|uniref:formyltransferase family protein n=1 Tax=Marinobacter sp. UBA2688 TaxID=1946816 RepID=UPI0025809ECF|nr:formyltransferase family protein [Marinobacter sp. UBA2688]